MIPGLRPRSGQELPLALMSPISRLMLRTVGPAILTERSLRYADYTENDRGFLDFAIPYCLDSMGDELWFPILRSFVDFYEEAPADWKPELRWEPSAGLRQRVRGE